MESEWIRKSDSVAIIFVHGILSTGETAWLHKNGAYWPKLLHDDPALDQLGIYVFSYQTNFYSNSYNLEDVVDALKEVGRLDGFLKCKHLIFVCHSMGGIVVRKFLVEQAVNLIESKTEVGLFLVASPSLGSSYANLLKPIISLLGHSQADALRFQQNNVWLNGLDKSFQNLKSTNKLSITGKELVEDKFSTSKVFQWFFRKQIVEPFSGARYFGDPFKVPGSDHFSVVKPKNKEAIQHRILCEFIKTIITNNKQTDSTKPENESLTNNKQTDSTESENESVPLAHHEKVKDSQNLNKDFVNEFIFQSDKYRRIYPIEKYPNRLFPIILQNNYRGHLFYVNDYWDHTLVIPSYVEEDWVENKRQLPGQANFYPWLTVSDFLEPDIIRLVYPINSQRFYDNGLQNNLETTKSYLLPLKKAFFDFFDIEDLLSGNDQKVSFQLQALAADSVKAILRIPLKPGELPIVFERIYYGLSAIGISTIADEKNNKGSVKQYQFNLNLMPYVKLTNTNIPPIYHIQFVDNDINYFSFKNDYTIQFYDCASNRVVNTNQPKIRSRKRLNTTYSVTTKYYRLNENFDYISVDVDGSRGLIIPKFNKITMGTEQFTFAVDFGTTNTHIEFTTQNNFRTEPLDLTSEDQLIATLYDPLFKIKDFSFNGTGAATALTNIAQNEWLPDRVTFPIRTALLSNDLNSRFQCISLFLFLCLLQPLS